MASSCHGFGLLPEHLKQSLIALALGITSGLPPPFQRPLKLGKSQTALHMNCKSFAIDLTSHESSKVSYPSSLLKATQETDRRSYSLLTLMTCSWNVSPAIQASKLEQIFKLSLQIWTNEPLCFKELGKSSSPVKQHKVFNRKLQETPRCFTSGFPELPISAKRPSSARLEQLQSTWQFWFWVKNDMFPRKKKTRILSMILVV